MIVYELFVAPTISLLRFLSSMISIPSSPTVLLLREFLGFRFLELFFDAFLNAYGHGFGLLGDGPQGVR